MNENFAFFNNLVKRRIGFYFGGQIREFADVQGKRRFNALTPAFWINAGPMDLSAGHGVMWTGGPKTQLRRVEGSRWIGAPCVGQLLLLVSSIHGKVHSKKKLEIRLCIKIYKNIYLEVEIIFKNIKLFILSIYHA